MHPTTKQYPVHLAAEGGSLGLLCWLVDELGCPLYDEEDQPLRTQPRGESVLGVASRHKHAHLMRWLVQAKECKVAEIGDRAQLLAAVEFLLLGAESGAGDDGYALGGDEVKEQDDAFDYGGGGGDQRRRSSGKKGSRTKLRQG